MTADVSGAGIGGVGEWMEVTVAKSKDGLAGVWADMPLSQDKCQEPQEWACVERS